LRIYGTGEERENDVAAFGLRNGGGETEGGRTGEGESYPHCVDSFCGFPRCGRLGYGTVKAAPGFPPSLQPLSIVSVWGRSQRYGYLWLTEASRLLVSRATTTAAGLPRIKLWLKLQWGWRLRPHGALAGVTRVWGYEPIYCSLKSRRKQPGIIKPARDNQWGMASSWVYYGQWRLAEPILSRCVLSQTTKAKERRDGPQTRRKMHSDRTVLPCVKS
jgi:hypothetical protein